MWAGIAVALAAIVTAFIPWRWSVVLGAAALVIEFFALNGMMETTALIFWLIAALMVAGLSFMLPRAVSASRQGVGYVAGGTLAGIAVGYLIAPWWMVLGAIIGTVLGAVAYSMTPAGRHLEFPSGRFVQYLCAKGFPAVVTLAMGALSIINASIALTAQ